MFRHILPEGIPCTARADPPAHTIIGVTPHEVANRACEKQIRLDDRLDSLRFYYLLVRDSYSDAWVVYLCRVSGAYLHAGFPGNVPAAASVIRRKRTRQSNQRKQTHAHTHVSEEKVADCHIDVCTVVKRQTHTHLNQYKHPVCIFFLGGGWGTAKKSGNYDVCVCVCVSA